MCALPISPHRAAEINVVKVMYFNVVDNFGIILQNIVRVTYFASKHIFMNGRMLRFNIQKCSLGSKQ